MIELPDQKLFTAREIADLLGISSRTVYRWNESGWLIGFRSSPRTLKFWRKVVEEFIEKRMGEI